MNKKVAFFLGCVSFLISIVALGNTDFKVDEKTFLKATYQWSEPERVSNTGYASYEPKVAVDSTGAAHVVWVEEYGGKRVFYNSNVSGSWGSEVNVTKSEVRIGEGPWPEIIVDNNNVPCILYSAVTEGNYEAVLNRLIKGEWTGHWNVSKTYRGGSAYPCIVIDRRNNDYFVFWQDDENRAFEEQTYWEIMMRYLLEGSGSWIGGGVLPDPQKRAYTPQATIDANGAIYIIYANRAQGNQTRVMFTQNSTPKDYTKWTNPIDISSLTGLPFAYPKVACDNEGNVYVVWMDTREGNMEVYFRKRINGKWSPIENLSQSEGVSENPEVAVNRDSGDIYVAWTESGKIFFKEYIASKKKWLDPVNLTDYSSSSGYPHLYVDDGGSIHIVFTDNRTGNWNIFYRSRMSQPLRKPSPPINLNLSTTLNQSTSPVTKTNVLSWEENEENQGLDIQNYKIYRRNEGQNDDDFQLLATVSSITFVYEDKNLPTDTKYVYGITAVDKWDQESQRSASVEEQKIFEPLSISLETKINRVLFYKEKINKILWEANPLNEPITVTEYKIYRKKVSEDDSHFKAVFTAPAGTFEFIDRGLSFDEKYSYRMTAVESSGLESPPSVIVEED